MPIGRLEGVMMSFAEPHPRALEVSVRGALVPTLIGPICPALWSTEYTASMCQGGWAWLWTPQAPTVPPNGLAASLAFRLEVGGNFYRLAKFC